MKTVLFWLLQCACRGLAYSILAHLHQAHNSMAWQ